MINLLDRLIAAFGELNWLAILAAAVATFVVGSIWYGENSMGKRWMSEVGLHKQDVEKANMAKIFGFSFILTLVSAIGLGLLSQLLGVETLADGLVLGGFVGIVFVGASLKMTYIFAQRSYTLTAIDVGYQVVNFLVMGAIIGFWQ